MPEAQIPPFLGISVHTGKMAFSQSWNVGRNFAD